MTSCRYCGNETDFVMKVEYDGAGSYDARECPECGLSSLYPFPSRQVVDALWARRLDMLPPFDPDFDWRLFFARRHFHDNTKVLSLGAGSKTLAATFAKEKIELVQWDSINAADLGRFKNGEFDAVFVWDMLDFIEDQRGFLTQVKRIVKQEGHVSIRVRDAYSLHSQTRGKWNHLCGIPNFMGRKFVLRLYRDLFNEQPHCFTQEYLDDSTLVTLGTARSGPPREYSMQVLVTVHHYLFSKLDDATGPRGRVLNTIETLEKQGVKADVSLSTKPSPTGYDIVHIFHNAWETQDALAQLTAARSENAKIVISTIYMDPSETNFVINVINDIFKIPGADEREALLATLAEGKLKAGALTQGMRFYSHWNVEEDQKAMLELCDRIICFSYTEARQISLNLDQTPPFSIVYNSANDDTFGAVGPELFQDTYGIKECVIAAGHVEWRKNQLMLLYALREHPEIPIVIVGATTDEEYHELCRLWAHKNTLFIPQLKHRHLASAFAASRVHAQPSWIEGISLSVIEAAMCGCTPVVADRAGEIEYYGDLGYYANPGSVDSIRRAVVSAWRDHTPEKRQRTADYVKGRYTFNHAVEMTVDAYRKTLGGEAC